jgi:hypothetical protein
MGRGAGDTATTRRQRWLCSRTQRLNWLALIPHSRASRDTDAPGLPDAATKSALAASSYTQRPSPLATDHKSTRQLFHTV